jgi:hypothetical protein
MEVVPTSMAATVRGARRRRRRGLRFFFAAGVFAPARFVVAPRVFVVLRVAVRPEVFRAIADLPFTAGNGHILLSAHGLRVPASDRQP